MTVQVGIDSSKTRKTLRIGGKSIDYYSIPAATEHVLKLNEISARVRFQFKLPAPCSDRSDIREGWTQQ